MRWTGAVVALVLAALLGGLAVVAGYLRSEVLNTDNYVATVAPLASDPAVQAAVARRLTTEIITRTDLTALTGQLTGFLTNKGAPAAMAGLVQPLIDQIDAFLFDRIRQLLGSPRFANVWGDLNRLAHNAFVTVVTGRDDRLLDSSGTTVIIDLGTLLTAVRQQLVSDGWTFLGRVPDVSVPFQLIQSDRLPTVRKFAGLLDRFGGWLPFAALGLFAGGVLLAPKRRRAFLIGALAVAAFTGLLLVAVSVGRRIYLDRLPTTVMSPAAAADIYDTFLRFLRDALASLLAAALLVALAAFLMGPGKLPAGIRRPTNRVLDAGARQLAGSGNGLRRFARSVAAIRIPLDMVLLLAGAVLYILLARPTLGTVAWLAVGVLAALALVEMLSRAGRTPARAEATTG